MTVGNVKSFKLIDGLTLLVLFTLNGHNGLDLLDVTIDYVVSLSK